MCEVITDRLLEHESMDPRFLSRLARDASAVNFRDTGSASQRETGFATRHEIIVGRRDAVCQVTRFSWRFSVICQVFLRFMAPRSRQVDDYALQVAVSARQVPEASEVTATTCAPVFKGNLHT